MVRRGTDRRVGEGGERKVTGGKDGRKWDAIFRGEIRWAERREE